MTEAGCCADMKTFYYVERQEKVKNYIVFSFYIEESRKNQLEADCRNEI